MKLDTAKLINVYNEKINSSAGLELSGAIVDAIRDVLYELFNQIQNEGKN